MSRSGLLLSASIAVLFAVRTSAEPPSAPDVVQDCPDCPRVVLIDRPGAERFGIGETEVTWHQYLAAIRGGGCRLPNVGSKPLVADAIDRVDDDVAVSGIRLPRVAVADFWRKLSPADGR